jgi:4-amino-4-deoxychorismate lyase
MKNFISLINGKFKKSISVLDRGLAYGDGFFETMLWQRFQNQKKNFGVEFWDKHLKRIKKGCDLMKINIPSETEFLKQRNKILDKTIKNGINSGLLKLIITRGVGGRGYRFENNMKPTLIFLSFEKPQLDQENYEKGVTTRICKAKLSQNQNLFGLKHLNRLDSVLARSEWGDDSFEGIFLDLNKNIIEGTMTNVFFVKKNILITPPIINSGINGVMRQVVINESTRFFEKIIERAIHIDEAKDFDQMFLTNSVLKILPVKQFGNNYYSINKNVIKFINFFKLDKKGYKKRLELV